MKNKKKVILNILKYGFLFLFFLYALIISYNVFFGDTIVNYGFSYAIRRGEIPYNDFNLIIPLFSPLLYTIPLLIWKNIISYYIFQSLLILFLCYLLEKLLKEKIYLLLPLIFLGFPVCLFAALFPGYNFILLLLIVILIYLEKAKRNDFLIGFIIGLCIITKHTIGLFFILPSLLYLKSDLRKVFKRIVGLLLPCLVFLSYLLITKSFRNFINLCGLGLFDFMKNNGTNSKIFIWLLFISGLIYVIYRIIKSPRSIENYYVLISSLFVYPLLDSYHLAYFLIMILILFFMNSKIEIKCQNWKLLTICLVFCTFLSGVWTFITFSYSEIKLVNYPNYSFRMMGLQMKKEYDQINKYVKKAKSNVVLFGLGTENYFYKITNDLDITYFDLPNYGNYGYDSYRKMTNRFDNLSDTLILVNSRALNRGDGQQYYRELALYVMDNYKYVQDIMGYKVYYKE